MRVVVIGAGLGGLAAAVRLSAAGHEVTVVEALGDPGGRARVFRQDGFIFDAGPTILTAPGLIEELLELGGGPSAATVTLVPLDPFYRVRFQDGSVFSHAARSEDLLAEVRRLAPEDVEGFGRLAGRCSSIFEAAWPLIDRPFLQLRDLVRLAPELARLGAHRSVGSLVERHVHDDRLRAALSFHPLLIGGDPFHTTSLYALIHELERRWGVWFAMGGTGALVAALVARLGELGGTLRTGARAAEVLIRDATRHATGVRLEGGEVLPADAVVSNADVATTWMHLVPKRFRPRGAIRRIRRRDWSMSLFVIYFGTDRRYDDVAHHEILMGPRYRGLLADIFRSRRLAPDFSLYLHRPTATDPSLAPRGCDAFYVLSPVPHLGAGIDWETVSGAYRDSIIRHVEERVLPGLSRHIVTERRVDPRYFRDELGSHLGSAFSLQPTFAQSAWFRPHNVTREIPNLYFCGAGTHPGAGVPGVLSSAKIVAGLIAGRG